MKEKISKIAAETPKMIHPKSSNLNLRHGWSSTLLYPGYRCSFGSVCSIPAAPGGSISSQETQKRRFCVSSWSDQLNISTAWAAWAWAELQEEWNLKHQALVVVGHFVSGCGEERKNVRNSSGSSFGTSDTNNNNNKTTASWDTCGPAAVQTDVCDSLYNPSKLWKEWKRPLHLLPLLRGNQSSAAPGWEFVKQNRFSWKKGKKRVFCGSLPEFHPGQPWRI